MNMPLSHTVSMLTAGVRLPVLAGEELESVLSDAAIVDSPVPVTSASPSDHQTPRDVTTSESDGQGVPLSGIPPCRIPIKLFPRISQVIRVNSLKRRRSTMEDADCHLPPKKTKTDRQASRKSSDRSSLKSSYSAKEPASIRRAQSLRSEVSECSNVPMDDNLPPTAPATPLPDSVEYARSKANPLSRTLVFHKVSRSSPKIPAVPIIAPPAYTPPATVQSAEDYAINRLAQLLLMERSERERDRLSTYDAERAERSRSMSTVDTPLTRTGSSSSSKSSDDRGQWEEESTRSASESLGSEDTTPRRTTRRANRDTWTRVLGIDNDFRKYVTGWIFDMSRKHSTQGTNTHRVTIFMTSSTILPRRGSTQHTYSTVIFSSLLGQSQKTPSQLNFRSAGSVNESRDEINELEEDDFGTRKRPSLVIPQGELDWDVREEGREAVTWDIAMGCLALSVKFHRDFLPPLKPDLESSQRDILHALTFTLGSCTPQAVLDELWNALPTLRKAIAQIQEGWTAVQGRTWDKLFEALLEPDMLQYPITLLTAAALVDSLVFAVARQYKSEAQASAPPVCKCRSAAPPLSPKLIPLDDIRSTSWQIYIYEAMQLVEGVILDVKDVLQLSEMELEECRTWLSRVGQE
ncbi:hypothetical protein BU15DRAFT_71427 [Melanogaster broomeanus]|nr:hypothetical protein BU15DRAFT_71427 [Melanogaster broomeanus]